jgi:hypothetical protein
MLNITFKKYLPVHDNNVSKTGVKSEVNSSYYLWRKAISNYSIHDVEVVGDQL